MPKNSAFQGLHLVSTSGFPGLYPKVFYIHIPRSYMCLVIYKKKRPAFVKQASIGYFQVHHRENQVGSTLLPLQILQWHVLLGES